MEKSKMLMNVCKAIIKVLKRRAGKKEKLSFLPMFASHFRPLFPPSSTPQPHKKPHFKQILGQKREMEEVERLGGGKQRELLSPSRAISFLSANGKFYYSFLFCGKI
jgi:hypothetical protein